MAESQIGEIGDQGQILSLHTSDQATQRIDFVVERGGHYEPVVSILRDGRVEIAEWATADDAARGFWQAVLAMNPFGATS